MAKLRIIPFWGIALFVAIGLWAFSGRSGETTETTLLCQGAKAEYGFDEALAYIQSAQGYLTGRVGSSDPSRCPNSTISRFLKIADNPSALDKFYDQLLRERRAMPSVTARYAWDVEALLLVNLECASEWNCAQRRIEALLSMGMKPSQSLVFCGFDEAPSPDASEVEGLANFRRPDSLPFICDELVGGVGISEGWVSAFADYFDGR